MTRVPICTKDRSVSAPAGTRTTVSLFIRRLGRAPSGYSRDDRFDIQLLPHCFSPRNSGYRIVAESQIQFLPSSCELVRIPAGLLNNRAQPGPNLLRMTTHLHLCETEQYTQAPSEFRR